MGFAMLSGCATTVSADMEYLCGPSPDPLLATQTVQDAVSQANFKDPSSVFL
jgi:hypothetical protein